MSLRVSIALSTLLLTPFACPQAKSPVKPTAYKVHKVVFQGKTPYSQEALEEACGLKAGSTVTDSELQRSAAKLINTGAFAEVGATLEGPDDSVAVTYTIKAVDASHMLRPSFDNFVWFKPEELTTGIRQRVPLYDGSIPEGGSEQGAVQEALRQMLAQKGVTAKVSSELLPPKPGQPFRVADYKVESPRVRIHLVDISAVPAEFKDASDKLVRSLIGEDFNGGVVDGLQDKILADYRNQGYQEVSMMGLTTAIATSTSDRVDVDVAVTLHTGERYYVSKVDWAGSTVMSSAAFTAAAKLHGGDITSEQNLRDSLDNLNAAYRNAGYADVIVDAKPTIDEAKHQVAFTVTAVPGPRYKLRELNVQNLSPAQKKEFDATWKLHEGDFYNAGYVTSFLKDNASLESLKNYTASFKVNEDPDAALVDLTLSFHKDEAKP